MSDDARRDRPGLRIPCCPPLEERPPCESIDIRYRLPFRSANARARVEVTLHFRFERCAGPLSLGDVIHTTTLLPGEKVRLFTSDRHSRFTFDQTNQLAYRHATTSEESFFMAGMAHAVSSFDSLERTNTRSSYEESAMSGGGGAGIDLGFIQIGGGASGSSFDAQSASEFARNVSVHAESSSRHVEAGVRAASSTSVGEVQTRTHSQGESQDHFESASRLFENPNHCHAISFFFYKIMKQQTVRFTLERIERRVIDPAAPTGTLPLVTAALSKVAIRPEMVSATHPERLVMERRDRESNAEARLANVQFLRESVGFSAASATASVAADVRAAALRAVDLELRRAGLVDQAGAVVDEFRQRMSWERTVLLPTAGVVVKGCLDDCNICEPAQHRRGELELERLALENRLLARRIELLRSAEETEPEPADA